MKSNSEGASPNENAHVESCEKAAPLPPTTSPTTRRSLFSQWSWYALAFFVGAALVLTYNKSEDMGGISGGSFLSFVAIGESSDGRPPLSELIENTRDGHENGRVVGDVQFLLDFAIVGMSRSGNTALMRWLMKQQGNSREILMPNQQVMSLRQNRPTELVELLYDLKQGKQYKRAYKSPTDLVSLNAGKLLYEYWPKTKLIVGVRHPVLWFQSMYNTRLKMAASNKGIERASTAESMLQEGQLPRQVYFHNILRRLGKTKIENRTEYELFSEGMGGKRSDQHVHMPNPVFLYDLTQLVNSEQSIRERFQLDLETFLNLTLRLKPFRLRQAEEPKWSICQQEHDELRAQLMEVALLASTWIERYFMASPEVTVSNKDYFKDVILESWKTDPCAERQQE